VTLKDAGLGLVGMAVLMVAEVLEQDNHIVHIMIVVDFRECIQDTAQLDMEQTVLFVSFGLETHGYFHQLV
jgi:hypothetical protein